jgi:hypothetical protein
MIARKATNKKVTKPNAKFVRGVTGVALSNNDVSIIVRDLGKATALGVCD